MTRFRPCIDLHKGKVKQIIGSSLTGADDELQTNHVSEQPASHFAERYRNDGLSGGHLIQLGPGNSEAARAALAMYPGGLQVGGGITCENAAGWLEAGASHVIVTSSLFDKNGRFEIKRLEALSSAIGRDRLVVDLSCRRIEEGGWCVAMDRWQVLTDLFLSEAALREISNYCAEFLVHAADVEGKCGGIDSELVRFLGMHCSLPSTYAGGASSFGDLARVNQLSGGRVDLTIGSALDLFGGSAVRYLDCLAWNRGEVKI